MDLADLVHHTQRRRDDLVAVPPLAPLVGCIDNQLTVGEMVAAQVKV